MGEAKKHAAAVVLIAALAPMLAALDRAPWEDGLRGSCGAFFSIMASNHLRDGLHQTGGIPVLNPEQTTRDRFVYYRHHPPMIQIALALVFAVTGESEAAARGLALTLHLLALYALAVLILRHVQPLVAAGALLAAALTPFSTYYGPFMNFEVPCLAMLAVTSALAWSPQPNARRLGLVSFAVGGLCDWPIFFATPFLVARAWRSSRALAVAYLLTPFAIAALVFGWQQVQVARGGRFPEEGGLALYLAQTSPLAIKSWAAWLQAQARFLWQLGSWPCAMAGVSTLIVILRFARGRAGDLDRAAIMFLAIAAANLIVFAGRSIDHDYYGLYFLPWIAVSLARGGQEAADLLARRGRARQTMAAGVVALLLVGIAVPAAQGSIARYQGRAYDGRRIALALRAISGKGDVVLFAGPYDLQIPFYAERNVFEATPWALQVRDLFGLAGRRTIIAVPSGRPRPSWAPCSDPASWQTWGEFDVCVIEPR